MARSRGTVGAGGGFGTGLLLLVGGLILKHSQSNMVSECSSGLGQVGQVFDPNIANKCSMAEELNSAASWATWIGGIMLACSLVGLVLLLVEASAAAGRGKRPAPADAAAVPPSAGTPPLPQWTGASAMPPAGPGQGGRPPVRLATRGCGHEQRPGARFCAVCGQPVMEAAGPAGLLADPGSGATQLLPPPSEPISPTPAGPAPWAPGPAGSVAGRPDEPPGFASRDAAVAWPGEPTARFRPSLPAGQPASAQESMTVPGGPGQPGARRSRWPVAAAVVLLMAAAIVAVLVLRQGAHGQAAAGDAGMTSGAGKRQAPAATATPTPASPRQQAAQRVAALLAQSVADRSSIMNAVSDVSQCGPGLGQAPETLSNDAASRQRLITELANLPGRSALPSQMLQALSGAWQASAEADHDLSQWSQDELSQGCTRNDQADPNFQAAAGPDQRATREKKAFVRAWNPIAAEYGLTSYEWGQL
jgi:hypothetical protein